MMRVSSKSRSPLQAGQTRMLRSSSSIMDSPPSSPGSGSAAYPIAKPGQRQLQPFVGIHTRLPPEGGPGPSDVRLADLGIVLGKRAEHDLTAGAGQADDPLGQVEQRDFLGIADVHRIAAPALHERPH